MTTNNLTPLQAVRSAYSLIIFTLNIANNIDKGEIGLDLFNKPLTVIYGNRYISFDQEWNPEGLKETARNMEIAGEQMCVIAFDCAMDEVFGKKPITKLDDDIGAARAIVYMLRNAFAHSIYHPVWTPSPRYQRICEVKEIGLQIDFNKLNGESVKPSQIGGWGAFISLLQFCTRQLELCYQPTKEQEVEQ